MTNARGLLQFLLGLVFLAAVGLALYAGWLEPSSLRLSVYSVSQPASELKGLRIAVISDLHGGSLYIDEAKIARVVAMTNAARPDLVLLTGDYMISGVVAGRYMPIEKMAAQLKGLGAPLGVYAVLGNHDHWDDAGHITQVLRKAGIPILENGSVRLPQPRQAVALAGIGDIFTGHADPKAALAGVQGPAICFSHSPDTFPSLPGNCALTIAGHTHGGQVWVPLLGRPAAAFVSRYGQKYAVGEVHEQGRTLFVSSGIGTSMLPLRFGVPPEVSLLKLE
jgi:hypothetical protein